MIREAVLDDLDQLEALENICFTTDRLSRRQLRYLLTKGKASLLVMEDAAAPRLIGYVAVLFSKATSMARLYSIAVHPGMQGKGIGNRLMQAAEDAAWEHQRAYMRAEVRKDNKASLAMFERLGYRRIGEWLDYYEDHMDAWRLEKRLHPDVSPQLSEVPYYRQTLDFTCGPAALMMAMHALDPALPMERTLELRLWREATTIFMTSGHGGCGPYGLALAAASRGFEVEVYVNDTGILLADTVRSDDKREVMRLVQEEMLEELEHYHVPIHHGSLSLEEIEARLCDGRMVLVLISSWMIYGELEPHWVVMTGFDDYFVYMHDPFVDEPLGETPSDSINMPIQKDQFVRMSRYGKAGLKAAIVLSRRTE
ncbi:MAG: GNAT family N-acetyltransferase/peptidase C39 family protein [Candidatus Thiodiazotropha sp.]